MDNQNNENCPCESGKPYSECCKKQYEQLNNEGETKDKIRKALNNPDIKKELEALLKKI